MVGEAGFHYLSFSIPTNYGSTSDTPPELWPWLIHRLRNRILLGILSMAYQFILVDSSMLTTLEHCLPALNRLRRRFLLLKMFSKGNRTSKSVRLFISSGYSLSSSQVCEFTHTDKNSCKMPWLLVVSRPALEPLS